MTVMLRTTLLAVPLALGATIAQADAFCDAAPVTWETSVAPALDGVWVSETLSGLAIVEGEAVVLPERVPGEARIRHEGGALFVAPGTTEEFALTPAAGAAWDVSMEGEAPLPAEAVFGDPAFGFDLQCPVANLPRYQTRGYMEDEEGGVDFTLYVIAPGPDRLYAITTATMNAPDGTSGVARMVSRFTR